MDLGKIVRIIEKPDKKKEEKAIPVPNWPKKEPAKEPSRVDIQGA